MKILPEQTYQRNNNTDYCRYYNPYYRIFLQDFLADILGPELLGIYQLIFPIYGICFTIYGAGIQTAISQITGTATSNRKTGYLSPAKILLSGITLSLSLSFIISIFVYYNSGWIAEKIILETACAPYLKIMAVLFPFCGLSSCISGYYYGIQMHLYPHVHRL